MSLLDKLVVATLPFVPKPIVGYFSKNYIAGPTLEHGINKVRELNAGGMMATMDLLGESSRDKAHSEEAARAYRNILQMISDHKLEANVSVKPTQMGLLIDKELCYNNIRSIVQKARELNNFVRIDMEDRHTTSDTIDLYLRLKKEFEGHVGTVIQAYLRRTSADIDNLIRQRANLRLCKGIYVEPREAAYKDMAIINLNYAYNLEKLLAAGCYVGIATHDEKLVWQAMTLVEKYKLNPEDYEFQMLLGVDEQLRRIIVEAGHRMRVYVPFGEEWYAYSTRRLKENPKMAGYVFKRIFHLG